MQNVSTAWKDAQAQSIVPESFIEIKYTVADPAAQADASATDNGHAHYSNVAQTIDTQDKTFIKYGTLEQDLFRMDGSFVLLPDSGYGDTGFVSSVLCGSDGVFASHPVITITFATVHSNVIPGVSITWSNTYGEHAKSFIVTAYNGSTVVATQTVTDNTDIVSNVVKDISGYNKITIEVVEWGTPYRRARIEDIVVGLVSVFNKSNIMGYEHTLSADLLTGTLPKNQVVFSISNVDEAWNPDNPTGIKKYLLEQQELVVRYGYKIDGGIEWIKAGTFYMSDWKTPTNGITAEFTATSLLGLMGDAYTVGTTTLTLKALAESAFTQANLPLDTEGNNRWVIDNSLASITVTLPSDFKHSMAEVVQLCANAACCVLYQDRSGVIHIEPLATTLTDYAINRSNSYSNADYAISKELKSVSVNSGQGTSTNSTTGVVQEIENPLVQNSTVANAVALWVKDCLKGRKTISGEYRSDPRADALDKVTIENKYAENAVFLTSIKYKYNGSFSGNYEGRVVV